MPNLTTIFTIRFTEICIADTQIDTLRAWVAGYAKQQVAELLAKKRMHHNLFHNHDDDGRLIERAPLVLYHITGSNNQPKCFTITGIGDGAKALELLTTALPDMVTIKGISYSFRNTEKTYQQHAFQILDTLELYGLYNWIGFTNENYHWWLEHPLLTDRITRAEKFIADHLYNLMLALGVTMEREKIKILFESINKIERNEIPVDRGSYMRTELCMSISFMSNISLPTGLGIGAYTAKGFGQIRKLDASPERQTTLARMAKIVL